MVDVNWSIWVALAVAALWFVNKQSGGKLLANLKSLVSGPEYPLPGQTAEVKTAVPSVDERVKAARLLAGFFAEQGCKEGIAAMGTAIDHLLDDLKPHAK